MPRRTQQSVAVCAFDLNSGQGLQIFPAGEFRAKDGRPHGLKAWRITESLAKRIINDMAGRKNRIVIDYEHQTLASAKNGQPAPAAGWINPASLEWREGEGLFATDFKWTARAKQYIDDEEYAYLSPVFPYNKTSGDVTGLFHIGLVNDAGLDGMAEVAAAKFNPEPNQEIQMDEELKRLLGLSEDASADDVLAACKALQDKITAHEASVAALKAEHDQAVAALKSSAGSPDLSQYAPVAVVESLKQEVAVLKANAQGNEIEELVTAGLNDGKLLPAQESWARDMATNNGIAALKSYLDATPAIAALKGQQTAGRKDDNGKITLSDEQVAVCKQLGIDQEEYIKTLEADA